MVDNFSKFVLIGELKDRQSSTIAKWIMQNVIGIFGIPLIIKSDNGSEFKGLFREICLELGIKH